jgi:hypothetical protein
MDNTEHSAAQGHETESGRFELPSEEAGVVEADSALHSDEQRSPPSNAAERAAAARADLASMPDVMRGSEDSAEKRQPFDIRFYVTDHSPDFADTGSSDQLRELYTDIKRDGIESVRYDWRWQRIEPNHGEYSDEQLGRDGQAEEIMDEVGLDSPTIVLSSPPKWATELYQTDKEQFFEAYQGYAEQVKDTLVQAGGPPVERVQILNELNNRIYTPVKAEDLPRLCEIARGVFSGYNPDIKLMATLLASNTTKYVGTPIEQYLQDLKASKTVSTSSLSITTPGSGTLTPKMRNQCGPTSYSSTWCGRPACCKQSLKRLRLGAKSMSWARSACLPKECWVAREDSATFMTHSFTLTST